MLLFTVRLSAGHCDCNGVQAVFEFGGTQAGAEFTAVGDRDVACFLRYHDGERICCLSYTESRTVTEAESAGHIAVVADRQDTSAGHDAVMSNNHGSVVER